MITTSALLGELYHKVFAKGKYKRPKLRKSKINRRKKKKR